MLATVGAVLLGAGLCLAFKSDREHPWLLTLLPLAVGVVLLTLPALDGIAFVVAGHLIEWARTAAPFLLALLLFRVLWWAAHRYWRRWPACSPTGRLLVLALTTTLGLVVIALLRLAPYLPDAARIAGEGARAGWNAGVDRAIDEAGRVVNGGDAQP